MGGGIDVGKAGSPFTFCSLAACCKLPTSSAPSLVSTLITAGNTSPVTQFSQVRKNLRIRDMAWKPYPGRTM
jgi:hypothetical protein